MPPSGGPKDKTPPKIVKSEPQNFSNNFAEDKIKITFDEFVQLRNIQQQLIISPHLAEPPEIRLSGKTMIISIKEELRPNTTYNFNFGNGVADITENNPLDSNVFVFSTGDFLDSLSIHGIVKDAFDLSPEEDMWVMLYDELNDSVPMKKTPVYLAKTKKGGSFSIGHIKTGKYKLFVLKDANANYLFDLPNEEIAFLDSAIFPVDTVDLIVHLFQEDVEKQYIKSAMAEQYGKLVFVFNRATKNAKVEALNFSSKKPWFIKELLQNKDTLIYWLTGAEGLDSLKLQVWDNGEILDTFGIKLPEKPSEEASEKKKDKKRGVQEIKLTVKTNAFPKFDLYKKLLIETSHPLKNYEVSKFVLTEDSTVVQFEFTSDDPAMRKYFINYEWKEETTYSLLIPAGTLSDIFDMRNDTLKLNFKTKSWDDYGNLDLKINIRETESQYIVQLMDEKEKVLREDFISSADTLRYKHLNPEKYKIKLIYDRNTNSKWDTGNYPEKQPERVIYYSGKLEIRKSFESEIEWKVE